MAGLLAFVMQQLLSRPFCEPACLNGGASVNPAPCTNSQLQDPHKLSRPARAPLQALVALRDVVAAPVPGARRDCVG